MGGHFEGLMCGIELWRAGRVICLLVARDSKLISVSRPVVMLDAVRMPWSVWIAGRLGWRWCGKRDGNEGRQYGIWRAVGALVRGFGVWSLVIRKQGPHDWLEKVCVATSGR